MRSDLLVHKRAGSTTDANVESQPITPAAATSSSSSVLPLTRRDVRASSASASSKRSYAGCLVLMWLALVVFAVVTIFVAMGLIANAGGERRAWLRGVAPPPYDAISPAQWRVVAVCHPRWHGIRAATYQLGTAVVEASDLSAPAAQAELAAVLAQRRATVVVFNGVVPGTLSAAASLRRSLPALRTALSFHGSFAQHAMTSEGRLLSELVAAATEGGAGSALWRIGMLKESNAWWLRDFARAPAYPLANVRRPMALRLGKFSALDGLRHVGVFSRNSALKNVVNQLAAACSLGPGVVVHTVGLPREAPYIERFCPGGVVVHGDPASQNLPNFDLVLLMGAMDVNLYVSLTECHPMVVMESIAAGTPCIASDTSSIYDDFPDLREQLVVRKHEDVADISQTLVRVLANISALTEAQSSLLDSINDRSVGLWTRFLNETIPPVPRAPKAMYTAPDEQPALHSPRPADGSGLKVPKVCFTTYELGGETGGGMGTLLTGLLRDLSEAGAHSVVIADVSRSRIDRWMRYLKTEGIHNVSAFNMETEAALWRAPAGRQGNLPDSFLYAEKALQFAQAVSSVHKREHCDVIELFEYAGVGYELLRDRSLYLGTATDGESAPQVVVRAHGSLTHIRMAEDAALAASGRAFSGTLEHREWPREASLIHGMELYGMLRADAILVPSTTLGTQYAQFYGFHGSRLFVLPPPLRDIIAPFASLASASPLPTAEQRLASSVYLVFGKQQLVKGTDLVVSAAVEWMQREGSDLAASFIFVGPDWLRCGENRGCVWQAIPAELRARFSFIDHANPGEVARLAATVRCAVFASRFETLGIAAHEINQLGVPLIVSRIPAYADYFGEHNAFTFDSRNSTTLVEALQQSRLNTEKMTRLSKAQQLEYPAHVAPLYAALVRSIDGGLLAEGLAERTSRAAEIHRVLQTVLRSHPNDIPPTY